MPQTASLLADHRERTAVLAGKLTIRRTRDSSVPSFAPSARTELWPRNSSIATSARPHSSTKWPEVDHAKFNSALMTFPSARRVACGLGCLHLSSASINGPKGS